MTQYWVLFSNGCQYSHLPLEWFTSYTLKRFAHKKASTYFDTSKKKHHWFVDCKIEITFDLKILNFFLLFFLTYPHFSMQNCLLCKSLNRCNDTLAVSAKFSLYWNDVAFYSDWSNACTYYISEDCQQQIKLCCTSCEMYQLSTLDTVFQKIITKLFFSISLQFVAADDGERQSE